ncbi:methylmalonyl Co-A mutase-associated GTPase MeaB [Candidatus Heimdallarchaeota archaeon B3_Heim]|nr:MAG: methylmalonyl Co-A mutase-associated GTPase MeaB [Candidatus Heimdallarchaeota archaeon B3_Heim]
MEKLVEKVLERSKRAIAKAITLVENHPDECELFIKKIFPHTGHALVVGITGPPGSGKSTLVNNLAIEFRKRGKTVGIIAVDPTSPFSGGALLGDRIRMDELSGDPDVFIRSMGSRGSLGGLSRATMDAIRVLDASGFDLVLVETVGAGQSEVEIVRTAHTTIVIGIPGTGDAVQAIKAGILEIADIYVVNKSDRPGAEEIAKELRLLLTLDPHSKDEGRWQVPVIPTTNLPPIISGIQKLADTILKHELFLNDPKNAQFAFEQEKIRRKNEIHEIIKVEIFENMLTSLIGKQEWEKLLQEVISKKTDPYSAARSIMDPLFR